MTFLEKHSKWQSMIKLEDDSRSFYFCESADWAGVVLASSNSEAAGIALEDASSLLGEGLQVSPCMRVKKIKEKFEHDDSLFRIDQVFADIGMHKKSKEINKFLKELKK